MTSPIWPYIAAGVVYGVVVLWLLLAPHRKRGGRGVRESDMYARLWKGAKAEGWGLFRIADGSVGKKPGDLAGFAPGGVAVLVEAKLLRRPPSPGLRVPAWTAYETHQIAWLRKYAEAGALALAIELGPSRLEPRVFVLTRGDFLTGCAGPPRQLDLARDGDLYTGWGQVMAERLEILRGSSHGPAFSQPPPSGGPPWNHGGPA